MLLLLQISKLGAWSQSLWSICAARHTNTNNARPNPSKVVTMAIDSAAPAATDKNSTKSATATVAATDLQSSPRHSSRQQSLTNCDAMEDSAAAQAASPVPVPVNKKLSSISECSGSNSTPVFIGSQQQQQHNNNNNQVSSTSFSNQNNIADSNAQNGAYNSLVSKMSRLKAPGANTDTIMNQAMSHHPPNKSLHTPNYHSMTNRYDNHKSAMTGQNNNFHKRQNKDGRYSSNHQPKTYVQNSSKFSYRSNDVYNQANSMQINQKFALYDSKHQTTNGFNPNNNQYANVGNRNMAYNHHQGTNIGRTKANYDINSGLNYQTNSRSEMNDHRKSIMAHMSNNSMQSPKFGFYNEPQHIYNQHHPQAIFAHNQFIVPSPTNIPRVMNQPLVEMQPIMLQTYPPQNDIFLYVPPTGPPQYMPAIPITTPQQDNHKLDITLSSGEKLDLTQINMKPSKDSSQTTETDNLDGFVSTEKSATTADSTKMSGLISKGLPDLKSGVKNESNNTKSPDQELHKIVDNGLLGNMILDSLINPKPQTIEMKASQESQSDRIEANNTHSRPMECRPLAQKDVSLASNDTNAFSKYKSNVNDTNIHDNQHIKVGRKSTGQSAKLNMTDFNVITPYAANSAGKVSQGNENAVRIQKRNNQSQNENHVNNSHSSNVRNSNYGTNKQHNSNALHSTKTPGQPMQENKITFFNRNTVIKTAANSNSRPNVDNYHHSIEKSRISYGQNNLSQTQQQHKMTPETQSQTPSNVASKKEKQLPFECRNLSGADIDVDISILQNQSTTKSDNSADDPNRTLISETTASQVSTNYQSDNQLGTLIEEKINKSNPKVTLSEPNAEMNLSNSLNINELQKETISNAKISYRIEDFMVNTVTFPVSELHERLPIIFRKIGSKSITLAKIQDTDTATSDNTNVYSANKNVPMTENEALIKQLRSNLNKITPKNYEKIATLIVGIIEKLIDDHNMCTLAKIYFTKSIVDKNFIVIYANLLNLFKEKGFITLESLVKQQIKDALLSEIEMNENLLKSKKIMEDSYNKPEYNEAKIDYESLFENMNSKYSNNFLLFGHLLIKELFTLTEAFELFDSVVSRKPEIYISSLIECLTLTLVHCISNKNYSSQYNALLDKLCGIMKDNSTSNRIRFQLENFIETAQQKKQQSNQRNPQISHTSLKPQPPMKTSNMNPNRFTLGAQSDTNPRFEANQNSKISRNSYMKSEKSLNSTPLTTTSDCTLISLNTSQFQVLVKDYRNILGDKLSTIDNLFENVNFEEEATKNAFLKEISEYCAEKRSEEVCKKFGQHLSVFLQRKIFNFSQVLNFIKNIFDPDACWLMENDELPQHYTVLIFELLKNLLITPTPIANATSKSPKATVGIYFSEEDFKMLASLFEILPGDNPQLDKDYFRKLVMGQCNTAAAAQDLLMMLRLEKI